MTRSPHAPLARGGSGKGNAPPAAAGSESASHRRRWLGVVLVIFLSSVAARALFLHEVSEDPTTHHLVHDEGVNDQIARAIVEGRMPTVSYYKAPLYMYTLSLLYRILGAEPMRARWVLIFVYALTPVLLLLLTRRLFGPAAGIVAGIVGTVFWTFVFHSAQLVDTSLASLFYVLLAYSLVALSDDRWTKWPVCGAVLGLAAITRPNILSAAPVLALTIVVYGWVRAWRESRAERAGDVARSRTRVFGKPALAAAGFTLGCCAAILPVTARNLVIAGERSLIGTYGGLNFYVANSPWSDGKHGPLIVGEGVPDISGGDPNNLWSRLGLNYKIAETYASNQSGRELNMAEVDAFFYALTRRYIREHPRKFLTDCLKRFCWVFSAYEFSNLKDLYRLRGVSESLGVLSRFHYGILAPMALLGIGLAIVTRYRAPGLVYYSAIVAALAFSHALFVVNSRFRVPTAHMLVPFAAYGVVRFVDLWRRRSSWSLRIGSSALLIAVGVLSNLNLFGYADANHLEVRMTYAQACELTKRYDLLREATEEFERAYFDELDNHHGRPWAHTLNHATPMTWLFFFYHRLGQEFDVPRDVDQVLRYGELMTQREPFNPPAYLLYFKLLLARGRQADARRMLDPLERNLLPTKPALAIECAMKYCKRFPDRAVLQHLERLLERLSKGNPDQLYFHSRLYNVRRLLAEMTRSASQPGSTTASRPTGASRPTSQEAARR